MIHGTLLIVGMVCDDSLLIVGMIYGDSVLVVGMNCGGLLLVARMICADSLLVAHVNCTDLWRGEAARRGRSSFLRGFKNYPLLRFEWNFRMSIITVLTPIKIMASNEIPIEVKLIRF